MGRPTARVVGEDPSAASAAERSGWLPLAVLASAQFVMVLDSSVMNVSISQIVADLDTTIQGVQLAITAYTLVMAALMLAGAKLGDIFGRQRTFAIGLTVYGLGSLTTASPPRTAAGSAPWRSASSEASPARRWPWGRSSEAG